MILYFEEQVVTVMYSLTFFTDLSDTHIRISPLVCNTTQQLEGAPRFSFGNVVLREFCREAWE